MHSNDQMLQPTVIGLHVALVPSSQQWSVARLQVWLPQGIVVFRWIGPVSAWPASATLPLDDEELEEAPDDEEEEDLPPLLDPPSLVVEGAAPVPFRSSNDGKRQPPRTAAAIPTAQPHAARIERSVAQLHAQWSCDGGAIGTLRTDASLHSRMDAAIAKPLIVSFMRFAST